MSGFAIATISTAGLIFLSLGAMHLYLTFFSRKLAPFDAALEEGMKQTHPRLTRATTVWKAWVGFNASHSTGAIFFGFFLLYAGISESDIIRSLLVQFVVSVNSIFYLWLGRKYWFRVPFHGILLATLLVLSGFAHLNLAAL